MKGLFLIFLAFNILTANDDIRVKKQCQYIVYENGKDNIVADMYLLGMVRGFIYNTAEKDSTKASYQSFGNIKETACKEALNDNTTDNFVSKYLWGVAVTVNKNLTKYSNLK